MRKAWGQLVAGVALVGVGVAGGWAAGASGGSSATRNSGVDPTPTSGPTAQAVFLGQLISYDSCGGLLDALHARGRATVGPYGFGGYGGGLRYATSSGALQKQAGPALSPVPAAAGGPTDTSQSALPHSSTNTQVANVDEPDTVKTDGRIMVSLDGQQLHIVDVRSPKLRSTLALPHPGSEMLLAGDRVVVLSGGSSGGISFPRGAQLRPFYYSSATTTSTTATIVDISNPDSPHVVRSWTFDAGEVSARVVGGTIRLVLSSPPPTANWASPRDGSKAELARATKINQSIVDATPLDAWVPHWTDDSGNQSHRLSACDAVATPPKSTGAGLVTVISLDPQAAQPGAGTSVFGAGDSAYAEGHHLYISDNGTYSVVNTVDNGPVDGVASIPPSTVHLLEFDLSDPAQARFLASGTVAGQLHDSYALSEYQDHLRVTTTRYVGTNATMTSQTGVSVLAREGDKLVQVGRIDGLGTGEQVYAVRYIGDRGYVVTFQQVDPLHVIDLSVPAKPVLRGILHIPGYSSQLLPLPDHQLLGIGQSVTAIPNSIRPCPPGVACSFSGGPSGIVEPDGIQLTLFDVGDPAHPRVLDRHVLTGAFSSALNDPHAITIAPDASLVVLPSSSGLVGAAIHGRKLTITQAAFAQPVNQQSDRSVIAGDHVFELTDRGVAVRAIPALKQTGFVSF